MKYETPNHGRYIVAKAIGVGGEPISADEPVMVIRASDVLAQRIMNRYIEYYRELPGYNQEVLDELIFHQQLIGDWQRNHGTKVADR